MDGFDTIGFGASGQNGPAGTYPYRYIDPAQIAPYWTMAKQYVLADHMFQTQGSGSFTGHQDLIRRKHRDQRPRKRHRLTLARAVGLRRPQPAQRHDPHLADYR